MSSQFKPKVLKDQIVKFYKKPKRMKNGLFSYGVIELDKPLFPIKKTPEGKEKNNV
mgnify:CR=1 FL=1